MIYYVEVRRKFTSGRRLGGKLRYSFETYVLDLDRRELRSGDHAIAVEPQVFDLLAYLIRNRDRVITQDDLLAGVWKGRIVSELTLRSRINAARAAIGDNGEEQRLIRTLPRRGFRFVGPVHEQSLHATAADVSPSAAVPDPTFGAGRNLAVHTPIEPMPDRAGPSGVAGEPAPMPAGGPMVARPRTWIMKVGGIGLVAISAVLALLFVRSGTQEPARMPASATKEIAFDPSVVPLISDAARRSLANYRERPDAKALAIARGHMVVVDGAIDVEQAKAEALRRCGAGARPSSVCRIYAVGTDVVWSRESLPLPAPGELRAEPIDVSLVADDVPTIPTATRNRIAERYVDGPPPKALALTTGGIGTCESAAAGRRLRGWPSRNAPTIGSVPVFFFLSMVC